MSKIHSASKILMIIACLAMVFALSAGVSAAFYPDNSATYLVGDASNYPTGSNLTITLNIQSKLVNGNSLNETFQVTLPQKSTPYTVHDAIDVWQNGAGSDFTLTTTGYVNGVQTVLPFTSTSSYIYGITYDNITYEPSAINAMDGWKFRVNTMLPQLASYGAGINDTYLKNGDVIDFYFDNSAGNTQAEAEATAARFTRIYDISISGDTAYVTIQQSHDWFINSPPWNSGILNFTPYPSTYVYLYDANNQLINYSVTTSEGKTAFSGLTAGGAYTVKVMPTFKTGGFLKFTGCSRTFIAQ
ncbi:MAG: hypothetical protein ACOX8R_10585 [Bacillota bacterium]|jgi:hypothetical protein